MIPALLLFTFAIVCRLASALAFPGCAGLANFAPMAALALCGPALVPRRFALALPLGALLVSDLLLNQAFGVSLWSGDMAVRYLVLTAIALAGARLSRSRNLAAYAVASVAGSMVFYFATNTAAWFGNPAYVQSVAGWIQALTVGLPGYPPTWSFFRGTLAGDLVFTALFLGLRARGAVLARDLAPAEA